MTAVFVLFMASALVFYDKLVDKIGIIFFMVIWFLLPVFFTLVAWQKGPSPRWQWGDQRELIFLCFLLQNLV